MSFRGTGVFDSESEYAWLVTIWTLISYKLNPINPENSIWQDCMMMEVIGVTKRFNTTEKTGSVDDLLFGTADKTMKQVFRKEGSKVIYDYLENNSHFKLEEIGEKPEVFSAGLERLLGSGAPVIEKLILKNLYHKLRLEYEEKEGYDFSDYVKELNRSALAKG